MSKPNRLYFGDCLEVMRENLSGESVDLIYLDPPFNSKRLYNAFIGGAQWVAFDDTWQWYEAIGDFHEVTQQPAYAGLMEGLRLMLGEGPQLAYLSYMANRLLECRRVLKPTGSIYLHCDPTMSHYLKAIMDGLFGQGNFRNEIIWSYRRWTGIAKRFQRLHDVVFFCSKAGEYGFNVLYDPYTEKSFRRKQNYHTRIKDGDVYVTSIDEKGVRSGDVWAIPVLNSQAKERVGYPTQKPIALLGCVDILVMMLVCQMLSCQQNNGTGFSISCVAAPACMSLRKKIASDLSRLCCGLTAPAPNGGCFRPNTGIGTVSINDSPVGLTKASGSRCFNISPATRTWNT